MLLSDDRREYARASLDAADLGDDPLVALARWIDEARTANALEPTAMTLSTVDADGTPSARVVLCKGLDAQGLAFFTNYNGRKGRALAAEPRAAATFFWPTLERQVRVEGRTTRISREASERYFHSRPRASQLAAHASRQSAPIVDRSQLEAEVARLDALYPDVIPLPEFWGGYLLTPRAIEFWQGRRSRLHDRITFSREADDAPWRVTRLAP
jgi:pyridoxamine 5'-phosphate oxidase